MSAYPYHKNINICLQSRPGTYSGLQTSLEVKTQPNKRGRPVYLLRRRGITCKWLANSNAIQSCYLACYHTCGEDDPLSPSSNKAKASKISRAVKCQSKTKCAAYWSIWCHYHM